MLSVGGRGRVDDSLDPMDPAAYSDVPRYLCTSSALHRFGGKAAGEDEGNLRGFNPPPTRLQGHYCTYYNATGTDRVVFRWSKCTEFSVKF